MTVIDDVATFEHGQRTVFECNYRTGKELTVDVVYPDYHDPPDVHIILLATRAADALVIRYDFERDGWVICMNRTRDADGHMEVIEEAAEVAFVPAWNTDDEAPAGGRTDVDT